MRSRLAAKAGYKWLVLGLLLLVAALNYADRTSFTALFPLLKTELGMSDVGLGLIGTVFLWTYAAVSPFAGLAGDRFSRVRIIIGSLTAWSAVTALTGFASTATQLLVLRGLLGFAEAFYIPAGSALIGQYHSGRTRAFALSTQSSGFYLGMVLGGAFAGYWGQKHGWRPTLINLGAAGIVLAAVCSLLLVPRKTSQVASGTPRLPPLQTFRMLLRIPCYRLILGEAMLMAMGTWIFSYWLPLYFVEVHHLSLAQAGVAGTAPLNAGALTGLFVGGWLSDRFARTRFQNRMLLQTIFCFASIPALFSFALTPSLNVMYAAIFVFSFLKTMSMANETPLLCELAPENSWSTSMGTVNLANNLASGIALLLAGLLKARLGLSTIFAGVSALMFLAGVLLAIGYFGYLRKSLDLRAAA